MNGENDRTFGEDIAMIREMRKIGEVWSVKFTSRTEHYIRWRERNWEKAGTFEWQHIMELKGGFYGKDEILALEKERNKGLENPTVTAIPNHDTKMVEIHVNAKIGDADVEITVPLDVNMAGELYDSIGVALANLKTLIVAGN